MRATAFGAFTLGAAILAGHLAASTGPIPLNCNRACLEGLIDQYLAAVVAHDPKRLPLSEDVKYTREQPGDRGRRRLLEDGQGIGNYKHVFADPEFGQVAFMGTMMEAGAPLLMSLRLRIELGRITEIESIYFKPGRRRTEQHRGDGQDGQGRRHLVQVDSAGAAAVAPGDDRDRRRLLHRPAEERRQGHQEPGTYPFTNDCHRIENGSPTTNVPQPANENAGHHQSVLRWTA